MLVLPAKGLTMSSKLMSVSYLLQSLKVVGVSRASWPAGAPAATPVTRFAYWVGQLSCMGHASGAVALQAGL
jgi:hypothetical protein